ncbi:PDR/VanB family oxidoreductase [Amycolatopsis sp. NPDC003861]
MEHRIRVRALRWEADDVISLELAAADGEPLPTWEPGAHIDLVLPEDRVRQYSLCGEPESPTWRVAVLREKAGSAWVHDRLRPGALLTVRGPRNHFPLVDAPAYVFIAGGIGITPILPMVRQVASSDADWRLHYAGRRRAFTEELARYGHRVSSTLERFDLDAVLDRAPEDAVVYCCGPPALLDAVSERCIRRLFVERFVPQVPAEAARSGSGFDVRLKRAGLTLQVADGQSILDAVEAAGAGPPSSCREGVCGTCETRVIEGDVDHRDSILTDAERATGETMMICVSRAAAGRLVLDL